MKSGRRREAYTQGAVSPESRRGKRKERPGGKDEQREAAVVSTDNEKRHERLH